MLSAANGVGFSYNLVTLIEYLRWSVKQDKLELENRSGEPGEDMSEQAATSDVPLAFSLLKVVRSKLIALGEPDLTVKEGQAFLTWMLGHPGTVVYVSGGRASSSSRDKGSGVYLFRKYWEGGGNIFVVRGSLADVVDLGDPVELTEPESSAEKESLTEKIIMEGAEKLKALPDTFSKSIRREVSQVPEVITPRWLIRQFRDDFLQDIAAIAMLQGVIKHLLGRGDLEIVLEKLQHIEDLARRTAKGMRTIIDLYETQVYDSPELDTPMVECQVPDKAQVVEGERPSWGEQQPVDKIRDMLEPFAPSQREELLLTCLEEIRTQDPKVQEAEAALAKISDEQAAYGETRIKQVVDVFRRRIRRRDSDLVGADELYGIFEDVADQRRAVSQIIPQGVKTKLEGKCIQNVPAYRIVDQSECSE